MAAAPLEILQPGAVPGDLSTYPSLPHQAISHPNWPASADLAAGDAVNFVSVEGVILPAGTEIYRVFGAPSHPRGYYWLLTPPPETQSQWRGGYAVEWTWDSGTTYEKGVVKAGGARVWKGPASAKPALDIFGKPAPGYVLPGGLIQLNVVSLAPLDITPVGPTPWQQVDEKTNLNDLVGYTRTLSDELMRFALAEDHDSPTRQTLIAQGHELYQIANQLSMLNRTQPQTDTIKSHIWAMVAGLRGLTRYVTTHIGHASSDAAKEALAALVAKADEVMSAN